MVSWTTDRSGIRLGVACAALATIDHRPSTIFTTAGALSNRHDNAKRRRGGLTGLSLLLLCACAGGGSGADVAPADAVSELDVTPPCLAVKRVGQPCADPCECAGGMCVLNEYAPFRFCTRICGDAVDGSPCAPEPGEAKYSSFCLQFPSDFRVAPDRFCAPLCSDISDCDALGAPWESCERPQWKGNLLYSAVPDMVCISPSAQGHDPVDPDTCQGWEALFDVYPEERLACIGFCDFLSACQELPPGTLKTCCSYACMTRMTLEGTVDKEYFKQVRCYFDNYQAFSGTALACTQPLDVCGKEPEVPSM